VNVGLDTLRQVFYATFDLRVHMDAEPTQGYTELWNELRTRIGLLRVGEKSPGQSSFGHIMQGSVPFLHSTLNV
jgi:Zn-dependent oligopeptidase